LGAPLHAGQIIAAYAAGDSPIREAGLVQPPDYPQEVVLRVLSGPQDDLFSAQGSANFYSECFKLTSQADRRGLRLQGPEVNFQADGAGSILSEPNAPGVVQVPPDGRPIILLNEQTVGGYAKIGTVISADLDLLGQLRPGAEIRFQAVTQEQARHAANKRRAIWPWSGNDKSL
jgi:allophanate hydrolase subunit 2